MVRGWLLDAYADYGEDALVLWLWTPQGARRLVDRGYRAPFYISGSREGLRRLGGVLEGLPEVADWGWVERRTDLRSPEVREVLEVQTRHYHEAKPLAEMIDDSGGHYDYRLYNVDLRLNQRYLRDHGIFPSSWVECNGSWRAVEDRFALDYEIPPVNKALLDVRVDRPLGIPRFQDRLLGFRLGEVERASGGEAELLEGLRGALKDLDPDLLLTDGGDPFIMPYLATKSRELGVELPLSRDPHDLSVRKGKSYFTYGKIVYKPGQYLLRGRVHLDRGHFAYREARLYGPAELSRLAGIPMQEMSRLTPGTAFTAMQINEALRQDVLVLWKKNLPEIFKTAEILTLSDRGGFIFEPDVGIHEGIYEIDFSSLYPSIMITRNISYETLNCTCCAVEGRPVPGLPYYTCTKHKGLVPIILEPLVLRRRHYKKHRKKTEEDPNYQRDSILKWTLVTCLDGSTVVPYKVNGTYRIDKIGDVIDHYVDDKGGVVTPPEDLYVFGPDEDFKLVEKKVAKVIKTLAPENLLNIRTGGGREILATPNHHFFVLSNEGDLVERRADELQAGDFLPEYKSLPLLGKQEPSVNVLWPLYSSLPSEEMPYWRIKGDGLAGPVSRHYHSILHKALGQGYSYRAALLWGYGHPMPLQFLPDLELNRNHLRSLSLGRGRKGGGHISFIPTEIPIDSDLAFFLGFYIGDGSGSGNMVRFSVGMDEPEIIGRLMNYADKRFGLVGQFRKETHANMWCLQFNNATLPKIIETTFGVGRSSDQGKLCIPPYILNAEEEIRCAFLSGLLASDGCVSSTQDWAFIASYRRDFVESISLLLLTLGIRHRFRFMRPNSFPLYAVDFFARDIVRRVWLKESHKRRFYALPETRRRYSPDFPVVESGLFNLCQHCDVRDPFAKRQFISTENLKAILAEIETKSADGLPSVAKNLRKLIAAKLLFRRIERISTVPCRTGFVYCFETEEDPHGFVLSGGALCSNSFGYQGYRNARYGRIECHETINAYARDILVRSMGIAEAHGYEVVHGIVDSLWLRATEKADSIERVMQHVSDAAGVPLDLEGRYKWIVFLPCKTTGVGALNRYYGLFEDGEMKLRGIELRKHDTPPFINRMEESILGVLAEASNAAEFQARIPRVLGIVREVLWKLQKGEVPLEEGVLTKVISKPLKEYAVLTTSVAALRQMEERGFKVEPGEYIRFIVTKEASRDYRLKVKVAEFVDGTERLDHEAYTKLVCRAAETLLAPFGYTEEVLRRRCSPLR